MEQFRNPSSDECSGPLDDVVAFLDVRSDGHDASAGLADRLNALGATIAKTFSAAVTHVVFKEGTPATLKKLKLSKKPVHAVTVLWVESCVMSKSKSSEETYALNLDSATPTKKGVRSMKPRSVEQSAQEASKKVSAKRKSPSRSSPRRRSVLVEETQFLESSDSEDDGAVSPTPPRRKKRSIFTLPDMEDSPTPPTVVPPQGTDRAAIPMVVEETQMVSIDENAAAIESSEETQPMHFELDHSTAAKAKDEGNTDADGVCKLTKAQSHAEKTYSSKRAKSVKSPKANDPKSLQPDDTTRKLNKEATVKQRKHIQGKEAGCVSEKDPAQKSTSKGKDALHDATNTTVKSKKIIKSPKKKRFVLSGLESSMQDCVVGSIKKLKGIVDDVMSDKTTHVITGGKRTLKVMEGILRGCWILDPSYALASLEAGTWLSEADFEQDKIYPGATLSRTARSIIGNKKGLQIFSHSQIGSVYFADQKLAAELHDVVTMSGLRVASSMKDAKVIIGLDAVSAGTDQRVIMSKWVFDSISQGCAQPVQEYLL